MKHLANICITLLLFQCLACKNKTQKLFPEQKSKTTSIRYAKGFSLEKTETGISILTINSPWPNAESAFRYALIPKEKQAFITINKSDYDAIVAVPVEQVVVTSTTHIPALETLGVESTLVGFPDTKYISSEKTRKRIDAGKIVELGNNEAMNTEMLIDLHPDVVIGFGIDHKNHAYQTIQRANIPVVYNGDWTEQTPLGKAEWIKFFAPFFGKEQLANTIFNEIETSYQNTKKLAKTAKNSPKVVSGALYKDVWYLPGGASWAAQFLADANAEYLWKHTKETGSLSLSWETVLEKAQNANYWIGAGQYTNYKSMSDESPHYKQFQAFKNKKVFTFAKNTGATGGLLYYELAPQRPDLVLKDLIHILHPGLLPQYQPYFFTPLE